MHNTMWRYPQTERQLLKPILSRAQNIRGGQKISDADKKKSNTNIAYLFTVVSCVVHSSRIFFMTYSPIPYDVHWNIRDAPGLLLQGGIAFKTGDTKRLHSPRLVLWGGGGLF